MIVIDRDQPVDQQPCMGSVAQLLNAIGQSRFSKVSGSLLENDWDGLDLSEEYALSFGRNSERYKRSP